MITNIQYKDNDMVELWESNLENNTVTLTQVPHQEIKQIIGGEINDLEKPQLRTLNNKLFKYMDDLKQRYGYEIEKMAQALQFNLAMSYEADPKWLVFSLGTEIIYLDLNECYALMEDYRSKRAEAEIIRANGKTRRIMPIDRDWETEY